MEEKKVLKVFVVIWFAYYDSELLRDYEVVGICANRRTAERLAKEFAEKQAEGEELHKWNDEKVPYGWKKYGYPNYINIHEHIVLEDDD